MCEAGFGRERDEREQAAAFAPHDDNPFPIVPDDTADAVDAAEPMTPDEIGFDPEPAAATVPEDHGVTDPTITAIRAPDSRQFLRALIALTIGAADDASLGITLSRLGQALADERQDEALTFQTLVDELDRGRVDEAALGSSAPTIAAFVARLVTGENASDDAEALSRLVAAAETIVGETLEAGGSRAWRRLARFAVTIGGAEPRSARCRSARSRTCCRVLAPGSDLHAARAGRPPVTVISLTDDLRGDPSSRSGGGLSRVGFVISGPVEIVILDR